MGAPSSCWRQGQGGRARAACSSKSVPIAQPGSDSDVLLQIGISASWDSSPLFGRDLLNGHSANSFVDGSEGEGPPTIHLSIWPTVEVASKKAVDLAQHLEDAAALAPSQQAIEDGTFPQKKRPDAD